MALRRTIKTLEEERIHHITEASKEEGESHPEEESEALVVTREDFLSAMSHLTPSVAKSELEQYQKLRKSVAIT